MRAPQDLIELPFAFGQLRLLMADTFVREAGERGVRIQRADLEALHRSRLVLPLLEVRKNTRAIATHARVNLGEAEHAAVWHPTSRYDLEQARASGRLRDPAAERYMPPARRRREVGKRAYESPVYLYSPHQMIMLPLIASALPEIKHRLENGQLVAELNPRRWWVGRWREQSARLRELMIALSALDADYYPRIIGQLSLPGERDFDEYFRWRERQSVTAPLRWLGVDASWIREAGRELLWRANGIDPLRDWVELVAETEPEKWKKLQGYARLGVDLRIAAEIFLRYYERLVRARRAPALPTPPPHQMPSMFDGRLKPRGDLDSLLTDYGLSPHPRLVLVLEGETEMLVMPRVMEHFKVPLRDDYIALQNAAGTGRDLTPLIAYAVAPRVRGEQGLRYLNLRRPLTRLLVVFDAEHPVATAEDRERRRRSWVDRIMASMPQEVRDNQAEAARVREQVDRLVHVRTWNRRRDSFEFAHFTDRMLAGAIDALDERGRRPSLAALTQTIGRLRQQRSSIDNVLHRGASKVDLAERLWPVLERKIADAARRNTQTKIPVVSVLDEAVTLANELPRRNLVIALDAR